DGTIVNVAGTFNEINNQIVAGIMSGYGRAATFQALDTVRSGKVAVQPLNCEGTNGKWITNSTADYNPTGRVDLQAASGSARGDVIDRTHVYAKTRGTIAKAVLGNLVIKGIRGQANVTRSGSKLTKTDKGTRLLSITNNGNTRPLPNPGQTIRIAGIGTLTFDKVNKGKYGLKVTAVQIKVLPGKFGDPDGATINLGEAYARISPK
ncbi:MAG: choice-of-anchor P family protein, partial [Nocardioidaceae bacterium]